MLENSFFTPCRQYRRVSMRTTVPMTAVIATVIKADSYKPSPNVPNNPAWYSIRGVNVAAAANNPIMKAMMNPVNVINLALGPIVKFG
jgi:hypothetical protein